MFFSSSKKQEHHLCVIDIGSGTVAGAFLDIKDKKAKPNINFTFRSKIKEAVPGVPYERYFFSMIASLEEVMRKLSHNSKKLPKEIVVYLRAPWLASSSRSIKKQSGKVFTLNRDTLNKLIAQSNKEFIEDLIDSGTDNGGYEIIDQRIEGVKINGYEIKEIPKKVDINSFEAKTFITVAPTEILNAIENVILSEFGIEVNFKSFSRSICNLSREFIPDVKDYILFDIGSLLTEISVVRDCQVVETMSLPQGYAHIDNEHMYPDETVNQGVLDAFANEHAHPKVSARIDSLIKDTKEKWIKMVSETLDKFSTQISLPSTLILMTESQNPTFFADMLKGESFAQYLITAKKFNVIIIGIGAFENVCNVEDCKPDTLLMAEALDIKNKYYA